MDRQEREARAERAFEEFLSLAERGEAPAFEAFAADRPEIALELRALHSDWLVLHQARERADVGGEPRAGDGPAATPDWKHALTRELLQRLSAHSARGARYVRGRELGRGGMGEVHEAVDVDLHRTVAIKTVQARIARPPAQERVPAHEQALHRFLEEAQVTAQLNHPGVVPVFDLGVDEQGLPYFAMARVMGDNLLDVFEKVRRRDDGWSVTRAVGVLLRVCETMAYAHSRGVVHRDLKPANVMVGAFGEVYVMDWGLAKLRSGREPAAAAGDPVATDRQRVIDSDPISPLATFARHQPGTIFYMSPEQAGGDAAAVGPLSDVYSVGAMLYELLAGRAPYRDPSAAQTYASVRAAVIAGPPVPVDSLVERPVAELVAIQAKAMARDPAQRYASMLDFSSDLRAYLENRVVRAHRTGALVELKKWVARNKMAAASIATGLALVASTLGGANAVLAGKNDELDLANTSLRAANEQLTVETQRANAEARSANEQRSKAEAATAEALARKSEAEAATALAQRRLAESHVQRASLARQRGRWRDVLTALSDARAAGYADEVEIRVAEARAHAALLERDAANEILDSLLARDDLGRRRAEALLIRADLAMSDEKDPERPLEWVREARAIGLDGADDAYARALLAETSADALDWIRKTLDQDPLHRAALMHELVLLFFLGRLDEAAERAAQASRLYPGDPDPVVTRICALALHGEPDLARQEIERCRPLVDAGALTAAEAVVGACEVLEECGGIELWLGAARAEDCDFEDLQVFIGSMLGKWMIAKRKNPVDLVRVPVFDPSLPALRKGFSGAVREIQHAMFVRFSKPAETEAALAAALAVHPEGTLHYFRGACLVNMHDGTSVESMAEFMRRAEASYRAAYETPAIVPGIARAARYWATYAEILLAKNRLGTDPEMRRRALDNLEWLRRQTDLSRGECSLLFGFAIDRLAAPGALVAWVDRWAEVAPDDPGVPPARVRVALAQGAYERALDLVEPLLAADPENAGLKQLRDDALAGLAAGAKRLEGVPIGG